MKFCEATVALSFEHGKTVFKMYDPVNQTLGYLDPDEFAIVEAYRNREADLRALDSEKREAFNMFLRCVSNKLHIPMKLTVSLLGIVYYVSPAGVITDWELAERLDSICLLN